MSWEELPSDHRMHVYHKLSEGLLTKSKTFKYMPIIFFMQWLVTCLHKAYARYETRKGLPHTWLIIHALASMHSIKPSVFSSVTCVNGFDIKIVEHLLTLWKNFYYILQIEKYLQVINWSGPKPLNLFFLFEVWGGWFGYRQDKDTL